LWGQKMLCLSPPRGPFFWFLVLRLWIQAGWVPPPRVWILRVFWPKCLRKRISRYAPLAPFDSPPSVRREARFIAILSDLPRPFWKCPLIIVCGHSFFGLICRQVFCTPRNVARRRPSPPPQDARPPGSKKISKKTQTPFKLTDRKNLKPAPNSLYSLKNRARS